MTATPRVAVATCRALPELDEDGPVLLAALQQAGLRTDVRVWDAPDVDWSPYDCVLVRSTWDYTRRREQFLGWAAGCRRTANPSAVLAWNTDKRYLAGLGAAGVPVVPTVFLEPGEPLAVPTRWRDRELVVKPTVSAASADTGRFPAGDSAAAELVARLHADRRPVMVQPYLPRIERDGETALVHLGGQLSHAVRKAALLRGPGVRAPLEVDDPDEVVTAVTPTQEQLAVARAALAAVPGGPAGLSYARVDLVPGDDGAPLLLELELTEPSLFLRHAPAAAPGRLAAHLERECARAAR